MKKHFSIRIAGKVQGVFFRVSTKQKADELFITGIVKNESDGSVYVEAEGEEGVLSEFIEWCKVGPQLAHVNQYVIQEQNELKEFTAFTILR